MAGLNKRIVRTGGSDDVIMTTKKSSFTRVEHALRCFDDSHWKTFTVALKTDLAGWCKLPSLSSSMALSATSIQTELFLLSALLEVLCPFAYLSLPQNKDHEHKLQHLIEIGAACITMRQWLALTRAAHMANTLPIFELPRLLKPKWEALQRNILPHTRPDLTGDAFAQLRVDCDKIYDDQYDKMARLCRTRRDRIYLAGFPEDNQRARIAWLGLLYTPYEDIRSQLIAARDYLRQYTIYHHARAEAYRINEATPLTPAARWEHILNTMSHPYVGQSTPVGIYTDNITPIIEKIDHLLANNMTDLSVFLDDLHESALAGYGACNAQAFITPTWIPSYMVLYEYDLWHDPGNPHFAQYMYWTYDTDHRKLLKLARPLDRIIKSVLYVSHLHSHDTHHGNMRNIPPVILVQPEAIGDFTLPADDVADNTRQQQDIADDKLNERGDYTMVVKDIDNGGLVLHTPPWREHLDLAVDTKAKLFYLAHQYTVQGSYWPVETPYQPSFDRLHEATQAVYTAAVTDVVVPACAALYNLGKETFLEQMFLPSETVALPIARKVSWLPDWFDKYATLFIERKLIAPQPPPLDEPLQVPAEIIDLPPIPQQAKTHYPPQDANLDRRLRAGENDFHYFEDFDGEPIIMPDNIGRRIYPEDPVIAQRTTHLMASRLGKTSDNVQQERADVASHFNTTSASLYKDNPAWIQRAKNERLISMVDF